MTETGPSGTKTWRYRFSLPDGTELEIQEFTTDEAAETYARTLSKAKDEPVKIGRHDLVDWEYVTEVDERR
jgi:hypothetical protein